jgi:hypothetical protein
VLISAYKFYFSYQLYNVYLRNCCDIATINEIKKIGSSYKRSYDFYVIYNSKTYRLKYDLTKFNYKEIREGDVVDVLYFSKKDYLYLNSYPFYNNFLFSVVVLIVVVVLLAYVLIRY